MAASKPEQKPDQSDQVPKVPILKNTNEKVDGENKEKRTYEVTSIPVLQGKTVPVSEKVAVFRKLKYQEEIKVKQYFEEIEDIVGFGMSNTYTVTVLNRLSADQNEETVLFFIGEKISCEASWLKTSGRALNFRIYNPDGDAIGFITRPCMPCFCFSNLCPCCSRNTFSVSLADGRLFGKVKKTFKFMKPIYSIYDSDDTKILELSGADLGHVFPCWQLQSAKFMGATESALINKQHTGPCMENVYALNLDHMMDVKNKMLLVALIVLIDFQHFRRCATMCHFLVFFFWVFGFFAAACYVFYILVVKDKS